MKDKNIYDFIVRTVEGNEISLEKYRGKVLLVANTASQCRWTPQLKSLEKVHRKYKDREFEVLAFPSNDFSSQEPLNGKALREFCEDNFQTSFTVFDKIHVKGNYADPLFKYFSSKKILGISYSQPRWNFYKYLVNREGELVDFFVTLTSPDSNRIHRAIERYI